MSTKINQYEVFINLIQYSLIYEFLFKFIKQPLTFLLELHMLHFVQVLQTSEALRPGILPNLCPLAIKIFHQYNLNNERTIFKVLKIHLFLVKFRLCPSNRNLMTLTILSA